MRRHGIIRSSTALWAVARLNQGIVAVRRKRRLESTGLNRLNQGHRSPSFLNQNRDRCNQHLGSLMCQLFF